MNCAYLAFTAKGLALAQQLAQTCPGSVSRCGLGGVTLAGWTAQQFAAADALVFVGAAGIAVRAIAPHCQSKATDPAVVVLDECGRFAVPLLSGHLGGANDLARRLAAACGAVPVITTATDANGLFAVDEWAKKQNCAVWETPRIKFVSGALLAGKTVRYASPWAIAGTPPAGVAEAEEPSGADFALTMTPQGNALHLIPRIGVLGVGCKRGTTAAQLEAAFAAFCADTNLAPVGITAAASIDLKQNEPGLLEFCRSHGWPFSFYSAAQLRDVPVTFSASRFVQGVTGVDNVCERAAVLASGGTLLLPARKLCNGTLFITLEVNGCKHIGYTLFYFIFRHLFKLESESHIIKNIEVGKQRIFLEYRVYISFIRRSSVNSFATENDIAAVGFNKTADDAQGCGFTAA